MSFSTSASHWSLSLGLTSRSAYRRSSSSPSPSVSQVSTSSPKHNLLADVKRNYDQHLITTYTQTLGEVYDLTKDLVRDVHQQLTYALNVTNRIPKTDVIIENHVIVDMRGVWLKGRVFGL